MTQEHISIDDLTPDMLDDMVTWEAEQQAANTNNAGVEAQLEYLRENGWTDERILDVVNNGR